MKRFTAAPATNVSRRRFVQGLALGGAFVSLGKWTSSCAQTYAPTALSGSDFSLFIDETPVNFTGKRRLATTVNGGLPGPTLRWKEGSDVTLRVINRLRVPTSIHWHGIRLPFQMDGVPGISFPGIPPGDTFVYRFPVRQSGTYWYHSHSGYQEQTGLYGAVIIDPVTSDRTRADRDYVVMLNDWSDDDPVHIFAMLKRQSDYYNVALPTFPDFLRDVREHGLSEALADRRMWNRMRMNPADLSDVSGYAFTYLMNGASPAMNWTGLFHPGERVRLRFINGSTMSLFDVRIPGLKMTVISADGQDVEPVDVDEFRIAVAETYDVIVEPQEDHAYTVFAQAIDRSGYARGTLAPRPGMEAPVPAMDVRQLLTMGDMMGDMSMNQPAHATSSHSMEAMPGMEAMNMQATAAPSVHHAQPEFGPGVDMRVKTPRSNLDDPGVGLRDNGRRVLTYADLHTVGGPLDAREPTREIELHLTGNMQRYMWSFDGVKFSDAQPIQLHANERVRLVLVNDTMMNHPIHLHGMWSELERPDGTFQVRKHTVNVQPTQRIAYGVTADALGRWAYHCHMMFHMEAGMFREVVVS
jgi:CopA family copper-resistance protein